MDFNIIIETLYDIQKELNGNISRYYEKEELEEKEEKQLLKIKEQLTKMVLDRIQKEPINPKSLCKHFLRASLYSNGILRINEQKQITESTFEIPESILKKGLEIEKELKKETEKKELAELKKGIKKISTKKTFTKKELMNFFNEEEANLYLMINSNYTNLNMKALITSTLSPEKELILKSLLRLKKTDNDYKSLICLLKEKEEDIIQKEIINEYYRTSSSKKEINLAKINFFKKNEEQILKELRKEDSFYFYGDLKEEVISKIKKLYFDITEKEVIEIKRIEYLKYSLLQIYFYYPQLTYFEKKLGLTKKEEFLKLHEIMQSLKKAIDLKIPEEGIYLGNDDFFEKKKIDFLKEMKNDN